VIGPAGAPPAAAGAGGLDRIAQLPFGEARLLGRRFGSVRPPRVDRRQLAQQLTLAHRPARDLSLELAHMPSEPGEQVTELRGQAFRLLEMIVAARSRGAEL
jgi:hypothetical protein